MQPSIILLTSGSLHFLVAHHINTSSCWQDGTSCTVLYIMNNETMHASLEARAAHHTTSLASFMADRNVKLSWIAFFALWILWCLLWFLRHVFGDGHQGADYAGREEGDVAVNRPWIRHPLAIATHVCTYLFVTLTSTLVDLYRVVLVEQLMFCVIWCSCYSLCSP